MSLDAEVITRLRKERDELCQTMERLRLERGTAREECNQAVREHVEERQGVSFVRANIGTAVAQR